MVIYAVWEAYLNKPFVGIAPNLRLSEVGDKMKLLHSEVKTSKVSVTVKCSVVGKPMDNLTSKTL